MMFQLLTNEDELKKRVNAEKEKYLKAVEEAKSKFASPTETVKKSWQ